MAKKDVKVLFVYGNFGGAAINSAVDSCYQCIRPKAKYLLSQNTVHLSGQDPLHCPPSEWVIKLDGLVGSLRGGLKAIFRENSLDRIGPFLHF